MSLSHDGYTFEDAPHKPVRHGSSPEPQIVIGQFFGVNGESHLIHPATGGRDLWCQILLSGYETTAAMQTAVETIEAKVGVLTGTLTETIDGNNRTWEQCTFLGIDLPEDIFNEPHQNWTHLDAVLRWRQRKRNSL